MPCALYLAPKKVTLSLRSSNFLLFSTNPSFWQMFKRLMRLASWSSWSTPKILQAWAEINFQDEDTPQGQIIWWNSLIRIGNRLVLWKHSIQRGLLYIDQLFENGTPITVDSAQSQFSLTYLQYSSILSALPKSWWQLLKRDITISVEAMTYDMLKENKMLSSKVYDQLTAKPKVFVAISVKLTYSPE